MRNLAAIAAALLFLTSLACGPTLQPSQQGEWSNFHNAKHQVSKDVRQATEKPPAER